MMVSAAAADAAAAGGEGGRAVCEGTGLLDEGAARLADAGREHVDGRLALHLPQRAEAAAAASGTQ